MASQQAKQMGLVGNDHGDWYDKEGNLRAKTVGGRLQIFKGKQAAKPEQPAQKEKEEGSKEKSSDTITVGFGRFNPPTIGHEKLINTIAQTAGKGGRYRIYPSRSQDPKKNPLEASDKVNYMRQMFPDHADSIVDDEKTRTIFDVLKAAHGKGYSSVNIVVGSDRVKEFDKLANSYNGSLYQFDNVEVISAGDRDPDSEGVEGLSASRMRLAASENDFKTFRTGLPPDIPRKQAMELFAAIQQSMGIVAESWQIAPKFFPQILRENYVAGTIYKIGQLVENLNTGLIGRIIRRGTNHLICVTDDNIMFKSWIKDVAEANKCSSDKRLVATDSYRKCVESKTRGWDSNMAFINKYRKKAS